jgi:hypothetical protein
VNLGGEVEKALRIRIEQPLRVHPPHDLDVLLRHRRSSISRRPEGRGRPTSGRRQISRAVDDSITVNEITDSLDRAFDRIDDFEAVQSGCSGDELVPAVTRLQESVGILDESRSLIAERLAGIKGAPKARGHVLFGLILGLMAAELDAEAR